VKIQWTKSYDRMVVGTVGDVECFHLIKVGDNIELVSSLPETVPLCVGRHIETHTSPKQAATHAQRLFDHWYERLHYTKDIS